MFFRRKSSSNRRRRRTSNRTSALPRRNNNRIKERRRPRLGKTRTKNTSPQTEKRTKRPVQKLAFFTRLKRLLIIGAILGVGISITYNLFLSNRLNLTTITVFEDQQPLEVHPALAILDGLKGSNILLINTFKLEQELQESYPYYAKLNLKKDLPETLVVQLETHPLVANLIAELPDGTEQPLLLNAAGAITQPEEDSITIDLPTIVIEVDQKLIEGEGIITPEHLAFMLDAIQAYQDKFSMAVLNTRYYPIARETHLVTERNFEVWLSFGQSLDEQINKLKQALPRLNIYDLPLEYIDLRISGINGEKVIYR